MTASLTSPSSGLLSALGLWLIRPLGLLGGTLLHSSCSAVGRLQAMSIGVAQLLASTLTGLGLAAWVTMQQWTQGELPPWSWPQAWALVMGTLLFDACLNVALNHTDGWRHGLLKTLRVGLTLALSLQASHMLLLMWNAPSLAQPALTIAETRFGASLQDLRQQAQTASQTLAQANTALSNHTAQAPSPSAEPPACTAARQTVPAGDWLALKQQRQAASLCASQVRLAQQTDLAHQAAWAATQARLQKAADLAQTDANTATQALATREALRSTVVPQLSQTPAVRQAAFEQLQVQDPSLRLSTWLTAGVALVLELMAMLIKTLMAHTDEAVLKNRCDLGQSTLGLRAQAHAFTVLGRANAHLRRSAALDTLAQQLAQETQHAAMQEAATPPFTHATYHAWLHKELKKQAAAPSTGHAPAQ